MKEIALHRDERTLITGSSGFIGTHICLRLKKTAPLSLKRLPMDISDKIQFSDALKGARIDGVIHLASTGGVGTPLDRSAEMMGNTVDHILRVLESVTPKRLVLISSCAVYGNTENGIPGWDTIHPVGMYGMSKVAAELTARLWAQREEATLIVMRLGNVIGEGCHGLIPYLVKHAFKYPDGSEPAHMRGDGRIVRDYVPVEYVVDALLAGLQLELSNAEKNLVLNVGTGRGTTNREVAEIVSEVLAEKGYKLRIKWHPELALGEASKAILNISETEKRLEAATPDSEQVSKEIRRGTLSHLESLCQVQNSNSN